MIGILRKENAIDHVLLLPLSFLGRVVLKNAAVCSRTFFVKQPFVAITMFSGSTFTSFTTFSLVRGSVRGLDMSGIEIQLVRVLFQVFLGYVLKTSRAHWFSFLLCTLIVQGRGGLQLFRISDPQYRLQAYSHRQESLVKFVPRIHLHRHHEV